MLLVNVSLFYLKADKQVAKIQDNDEVFSQI